MQTRRIIRLSALVGWLAAAAELPAEILVGDSPAKVRAELGEPTGSIRAENYELLQFDRGRVEIRDGAVTRVELVSAEEASRLRMLREQEARDLKVRQEQERIQRKADGTEARDRALQNPDFLNSSGDRQVQFWEDFRRRYPEVPVGSEYAAALARRDADFAPVGGRTSSCPGEQRVADAEVRAENAERDAEEARRNSRRSYVYYGTPIYYGQPACPPLRRNYTYGPSYPRTGYPYSHGYSTWGTSPYHETKTSIRFRTSF